MSKPTKSLTTTSPDSPAESAAAPAQDAPASQSLVHQLLGERNLPLLLDVELGVTLRFGTREMPLREILELSTGSVIELDRQLHEPVDLLIDQKLIARGEVVIVNGNYGLRVTEVASAQNKIACLQE